jgi:hypothetical protein
VELGGRGKQNKNDMKVKGRLLGIRKGKRGRRRRLYIYNVWKCHN